MICVLAGGGSAYLYTRGGIVRQCALPYRFGKVGASVLSYVTNTSLQKDPALMADAASVLVSSDWERVRDALVPVFRNKVPWRDDTWQLVGVDVVFDTSGSAWLLEVQTNPSLSVKSEVDTRVKPQLCADIVQRMLAANARDLVHWAIIR